MSLCFIVIVHKYTNVNSDQSDLETENKWKNRVKNYPSEKVGFPVIANAVVAPRNITSRLGP